MTNREITTKITELFAKLPIVERVKVIRIVLSPEIETQIKSNKKNKNLFKTIRNFWKINNHLNENELEKDVEEAISFAKKTCKK